MERVLVNGVETNRLPVTDRGLHYGDGLFETIAIRNGEPLLWSLHIQRLLEGCRRLSILPPDEQILLAEIASLAREKTRAVVKVMITRGSGGRGYRSDGATQPTRIVILYPWPDYPSAIWQSGVAIRLCHTRLGSNAQLAGIKHLNRLEQVLARSEWRDPAIFEGVVCNQQGLVIEATMSNLFLVKQGELITPDLQYCGVAGVMREAVLQQARQQGIATRITDVTVEELRSTDELFLTNAVIGVVPVVRFEDISYTETSVGKGMQQGLKPVTAVWV